MQSKDKNGDSKEGSGRVALYQQTGLVHIYTVEANYCCSRIMNQTYPAVDAPDGRVTPPNRLRASPKYCPQLLHGTGRALMIGLLDLEDANPWSRLPQSPYASLAGVRDWVKACLSVKQDAGGGSSAVSSEPSFAARGPSPNALPRGASLKKAGDLGGLKPKEVLAEIEKRRRTAASQPKQTPGTSSDLPAPRRKPLPARRSSNNTSFGRTSEPQKEAPRPFRRSNSVTESSSKSQQASLSSEQELATGGTGSGQRLPPGRGVLNPHAARAAATCSSADLLSKPPPLDVDVEIDSGKMEELRNFVVGGEGSASGIRGNVKAGRRASLTTPSPSGTGSACPLPYAMAHDPNLVSDALPYAPAPPGGGSSSASSAAALLAASRKQQRERIDVVGRGGSKSTSGEPLMFGTLVQGKSFGRRASATGDSPGPTVSVRQEGVSHGEAPRDNVPITKGRSSSSLSPPGRAASIIPTSRIIPVEAE